MRHFRTKLLFTMLICMVSITTFAHDIEANNDDGVTIYYKWNYNKTGLIVTFRGDTFHDDYYEYKGNVIIPGSVTYQGVMYPVISISERAFEACPYLVSVTIPNTVSIIGEYAFEACESLKSLTINTSVKYLGNFVFRNSNNIQYVKVPVNDNAAFCNANLLYLLGNELGCPIILIDEDGKEITEFTIPEGVNSISNYAFANCSHLTSVIIPSSLTNIGSSPFFGCSALENVKVPVSDFAAFCNNEIINLIRLQIGKPVMLIDVENSEINEFSIPEGVANIGDYAFYNCTGLTNINISNSVLNIGSYALGNCSGLLNLTIPNSVNSIDKNAFSGCSSIVNINISVTDYETFCNNRFCNIIRESIGKPVTLIDEDGIEITKFTIPENITSIGEGTFANCFGLNDITICNSVSNIGQYAFAGCSGLTRITIPNSISTIDFNAFEGCNALENIRVPYSDYTTFSNNGIANLIRICIGKPIILINDEDREIKTLSIPEGVTDIPEYTFYNCYSLASITIPSSLKSIGQDAFSGSNIIKTFWLSNTPPSGWRNAKGNVNYVSNNQFGTLDNIIVYPYLSSMFEVNGIKYVPVSPSERTCDAIDYDYYESMSEVNIKESVSYQGISMRVMNLQPYLFYYNNGLRKIYLDITGSIGKHVFDGCNNIQTVTLDNNITGIEEYAFSGCSKLESIVIPNSVKSISQYAFQNCSGMISFETGDGTKTIGKYAFSGCSSLNSAVIGNGVNTIDEYAFSGCSSLNSVIIGNNTRFIQQYAFSGCTSLPKITIPGSVHNINDFAFEGCYSLKEVNLNENKKDIEVETNTFNDVEIGVLQYDKDKTILTVFVSENDKLSFDYKFNNSDGVIHIKTPSGTTNIYYDKYFRGAGNYTKTFDKAGLLTITFGHTATALSNPSCKITNIQLTYSDVLGLGSNNTKSLFVDCPLDFVCINRKISYSLSPFSNNTTLRSAVITGKEEKISPSEFYGCTNLQNVQIGNGVTSIGDWAFSGCSGLKSFSFGTNVSNIGKEAFSDCIALTKLISHTTTPPICGDQALDDINKWTCKLFVPKGCVSDYQNADQWKDFWFMEESEPSISNISGDANGDNVVDDKDINAIVEFIMNGKSDGFNFNNADTNNDQKVNAADIVKIVNMIKK